MSEVSTQETTQEAPTRKGAFAHSRLSWFLIALILASLMAYLQTWFLADFIYWKYIWIDLPMHFLGGLFAGVFAVAFLVRFLPIRYIAFVLFVFIGWEVFEWYIGAPQETNYVFDTSLDLLMDTLGAIVAYLVARFSLWHPSP